MTINELIKALQDLGDDNFRDMAKVRVLTQDGNVLGEPDYFDIKRGITSADIFLDELV